MRGGDVMKANRWSRGALAYHDRSIDVHVPVGAFRAGESQPRRPRQRDSRRVMPRWGICECQEVTLRQIVIRWTPYWRAKSATAMPSARRVRILPTWVSVSRVGVRPIGSTGTAQRGPARPASSSPSSQAPCSQALTSRNTACRGLEQCPIRRTSGSLSRPRNASVHRHSSRGTTGPCWMTRLFLAARRLDDPSATPRGPGRRRGRRRVRDHVPGRR
jgi:hypothetical protein